MTTEARPRMRPDLEKIAPERINRLPIDPDRGYPVPWFCGWFDPAGRQVQDGDGKPEFRAADPRKYARAVREHLCWVCGEVLGRRRAFVIGPMCTINRISAEPPNHWECAIFSMRACPFLTRPGMERRETDLPDGSPIAAGGMMGGQGLLHNPGVMVLYIPMNYEHRPDGSGGYLFHLGEPLSVEWWTEGREAKPVEAAAAFDLGVKRLRQLAEQEGAAAVREFERLRKRARNLLPY